MVFLRALRTNDGRDIFCMLKEIGIRENSFTNPVHDMTFEQFREWLALQERWSRDEDLPEGYVGQSVFWLFDEQIPVGFGKIRHRLTEASRTCGGNIGYAVRPGYRGKGYGRELLRLLIGEARNRGIDELLLTVDKGNTASRRVIEDNGGVLIDENEERWYFAIP